MDKSKNTISVSEFNAKCLGIIEEVHQTEKSVIVTKHGIPFVMVIPFVAKGTLKTSLFGCMKDTLFIHDDTMQSLNDSVFF